MKNIYLIGALSLGFSGFTQEFNYLDINNVKALISNRGDMHWDMYGSGNARYEVPKGSDKHSDFAACMWLGGIDPSGDLHVAAQTYRQAGVDFWPGPLDTISGGTNQTISNQYNKIWKINKADINTFITNFNNGNVQSGAYMPNQDFLTWPAKGTGNYARNLAPFVDINQNGIYDPLVGGDYPKIKGDQTLYYIYNDNLATHGATGGLPLKVEVHGTAYAYLDNQRPYINNTTFYNYKIINRSNVDYHNVYMSMWTDVDIGNSSDDYIGCNVKGNYGYAYNGDVDDETGVGVNGYGTHPPAAGYQILKGVSSNMDGIDNNNNGLIDETCEQQLMTRFGYIYNSLHYTSLSLPQSASDYYDRMAGYWNDGTPFTCGGNGYGNSVQSPFIFPGNTYTSGPCGAASWNEQGVSGDRNYVITTGPFLFERGSMKEIEFAHQTSFDNSSTNNPLAVLAAEMEALKYYNEAKYPPQFCSAVSVKEMKQVYEFSVFPNPANSLLKIKMHEKALYDCQLEIIDVLGKVQQTKKYTELIDAEINVSELNQGIYFLKLSVNGKTSIKKFVKE